MFICLHGVQANSLLDSGDWNVILPFQNKPIEWRSSITSGVQAIGDSLLLTEAGQVRSSQSYSQPYTFSGTFNGANRPIIGLRSDATSFDQLWGEPNGIWIWFNGDASSWSNWQVNVHQSTDMNDPYRSWVDRIYTDPNPLPNLDFNNPINFAITDWGNSIDININGSLYSSVNVSTLDFGGHVTFASWWPDGGPNGNGVLVSNLNVQPAPEPSALSLIAVGLGAVTLLRRRRS
jgi:hypothetical protein